MAEKNTVLVAYNSPRGIKLTTSKGEKVLINGAPVNKILDADGNYTYQRFGLTKIPADVWADIKKTYANASFFTCKPPKMFAYEKPKNTVAQAKEQKDQKNGFEQVDPKKTQTKELKEDNPQ